MWGKLKKYIDILANLLVIIIVLFRGSTTNKTVFTGSKFRYVHGPENDQYVFESQERKHTTKYARWFMPRKIRYSYVVEIAKVVGNDFLGGAIKSYPLLCTEFLRRGTFAHRCAIAACITEMEDTGL